MNTLSKNARVAGFFYLLVILIAPLRLVYIPSKLFINGDTAATIAGIAAHEQLFRFGIAGDLITGAVSLVLTFTLYRLFRDVNKNAALLMLMLGFMDTPLYFFNTLNDMATLILVQGPDFLSAFSKAQRDGLATLFLRVHSMMTFASEIFWGLWLFPLAALVYRCGFLPRFLAVWLTINGFAYLALSYAGLLRPEWNDLVAGLAFPCQLGEVAFALWILLRGAKQGKSAALPAAVAA
ncbi:DUF4386 domain-containing protein [Duganella sp. BJB488]|uniref:DUF4386 domain-containing protein n=1 Tax=unclassified Duganella TaxID=2636909 RepID=UPI000E357CED|nr:MULTISPECIES: DUF4386 domain-containing protein [unclassified Duganella]RFP08827.1 DUF4386 domain-containing protein [Duganella sp. BJB489]RFP11553.1 DUF4386 domain-containing protein [Duganella sp. BJB488]RFP28556.1 DUF4386 domain-containing protein [Duganella sp. BJB480]